MMTATNVFAKAATLGLPMAQHQGEIGPCVEWILDRIGTPERILEIGTQHGGTAALWCEMATKQVISVDMPHGVHGGLSLKEMEERNEVLKKAYPHFHSIIGNSQEIDTISQAINILDGPLDLLFIDGDHRYAQAKRDYEMYRGLVRRGGVVLFHDIDHTRFYDTLDVTVYRLWEELEGEKKKFSIGHPEWGGLGALVV